MVALRKPEDLGPPSRDDLPLLAIQPHSKDKAYYLCRYIDAAATATKPMPGRPKFGNSRAYIDLFAGPGKCEVDGSDELIWSAGLLALQVDNRFDLYILNDLNPESTAALAERARMIGIPGAVIFEIDLRLRDAGWQLRDVARVVTPFGPKVVITTGDANTAPFILQPLIASLGRRRYALAVIDPFSAVFHWKAFEALTLYERAMDVLALFPDEMDLGRNLGYYLNSEKAGRKLDLFFGTRGWREIVRAHPQRAEHVLRVLYEEQMQRILGFKIGQPRAVGRARRPLYQLIFGSKDDLGIKLWNEVGRRTPGGQDELFLGM